MVPHVCVDYVVILEQRVKNGRIVGYILVTAFVLEGESSRRGVQKNTKIGCPKIQMPPFRTA
jgi:hypothetical protein